jgi:3-dehydroquinate dehydratase/shikimate dehydrogenase
MTRLCVSILVQDIAQAKRDIADAVEAGAEMIELRMDPLPEVTMAEHLQKACSVPCIITCRCAAEGGHSDLSDVERLQFLRATMETPTNGLTTNYCDAEYAAVRRLANHGIDPLKLILSHHDYSGRPPRLYNLLEEMTERPAAVNKVAWSPRSIRDCQEAFELLQARTRPTIAICMGEHGAITRILAKKFGAFLTFAAVREDAKTAPGQPTIEELKNVYRWDDISPETRVYGVVGSPIRHSMSPVVHNAAFGHDGIDAVYVPLLVNEGYESFKAFMETYVVNPPGPLRLDGLSITIPHKENAYRYLASMGDGKHLDANSMYVRAVNTIGVRRDGGGARGGKCELFGTNTDYNAILDVITTATGLDRKGLAKLRVAIVGAGGVGRTATAALAAMGATVTVYNRSTERADALVEEFDGRRGAVFALPIASLPLADCDVYINATSLGMFPNVKDSPFDDGAPKLGAGRVVFDTVYNPVRTKLLLDSEAAGAKTVDGVDMFVRQAAAQYELWTQQPAPVELMRKVLTARLEGIKAPAES